MATRWPESKAGTIYEGSSVRTADQLNACVVLLAAEEGWDHDGARPIAEKLDSVGRWFDDPDDSEALTEAADKAIDWLSENVAPEGYFFALSDGLVLVSDEELEDLA